MRRALPILFVLAASCVEQGPPPNQLSSFKVRVLGVFEQTSMGRQPLGVVSACVALYNGAANVPADVKGQPGCRYVIPRGEVEFDITADAIGLDGMPYSDFNGTVSFRVIPGDLTTDLRARWTGATLGHVDATVKALHPYSAVAVWVEDAPPKMIFDAGTIPTELLPPEPAPPLKRTFASGSSPTVYFADQTLQSLQDPGQLDNRSSPFNGEFVVVGRDPASGDTLKQTCTDDPARNGREALMVVTGLDPSGFFVTDISACRLREQLSDAFGQTVRTGEPIEQCVLDLPDGGRTENLDGGPGICPISQRPCTRALGQCFGYSPGAYASMFIYNYNFPDGLDEGDLLFTLSGSIQEFTSTTQMVFPAWTTAERVRRLPESQWNKWLQFARPYEINARTCGQDNAPVPFLTDALCGHNRRNMKMESLESGLVKLRRITFPKKFVNCDFNSNGSVPFFCENPNPSWRWDKCGSDTEPENDRLERECTINCTIGYAEHAGVLCAEQSTFKGFGQYVVEMSLPGPARLGMDDALPRRMNVVAATITVPRDAGFDDAGMAIDAGPPGTNPSVRVGGYTEGTEVALTCDAPARFKFGNDIVFATDGDLIITPDQIIRHTFGANETSVAFQATTTAASCTVGLNARTRINIVTKDAVPELNPDCDENDADVAKARECRNLRGAEFNLVGHMRHVQPARPRWVVIPRAPDDLCCYPGPGLECPKPIKPCAGQ